MSRRGAWFFGAVIAALAIAALLSPWASPWPDGLEKVAEEIRFHAPAMNPPVPAPLPDYTVPALGKSRASTAAAGTAGTLLVLGLATGWGWLLARPRRPAGSRFQVPGSRFKTGRFQVPGGGSAARRAVGGPGPGRSQVEDEPEPGTWNLEPGTRPQGALPDARIVLLSVVLYVVVVAVTPAGRWTRLGALAALAAVGLGWARVPARWALGRLAVLAPFVLLALMSAPFMRRTDGVAPAVFCGSALAKALLSFCALAVLARSVALPDLLAALGRLRVPPILVSMIALMLRYLDLFEDEARRMMRARDARGIPPTLRRRAAVAGHMVGALFVRSYERSERISQSMLARGFNGALIRHSPSPLTPRDWTVALCLAAALAAVLLAK